MSRGARKLLEQNLNASDDLHSAQSVNLGPSPGPGSSSSNSSQQQCVDVKTGQVVNCTTPPTALIIVAGMACMTFLVTIALLLLFFSFVKQRRQERQRRQEAQDQQRSSHVGGLNSTCCHRSVPPVSSEYDEAVLVHLPGEVKPNFFAVPMPLVGISSATDAETVGDNELGEDDDGHKEKETLEECAEQQETESIDETRCVIARGDGSYDNHLFTPG